MTSIDVVGGPWLMRDMWEPSEHEPLVAADERCVSRWVLWLPGQGGYRHRSEPCGGQVAGVIAGAALCAAHMKHAAEWHRELTRQEAAEVQARATVDERRKTEARKEQQRAERAFLASSWAADGPSIVYYLRRRTDGIVKIGTTKRRAIRFGDLAKEHGKLDLLLSHVGGLDREHRIHAQFGVPPRGGRVVPARA